MPLWLGAALGECSQREHSYHSEVELLALRGVVARSAALRACNWIITAITSAELARTSLEIS